MAIDIFAAKILKANLPESRQFDFEHMHYSGRAIIVRGLHVQDQFYIIRRLIHFYPL